MTPRRRPRRSGLIRALVATTATVASAAALAGCGSSAGASGPVRLDFFQFKGEAAGIFEEIVTRFEADNPDIDVVINQVPDADTAIRTLLLKNRTPDVMTLNGSGNFGRLAQAGVFRDFTDDAVLGQVNPAVQDVLNALGTYGDEVNALGFSSNANGIIYNRALFAEHGVAVPRTWDELIAAARAFDAAGVTPVIGTFADAWTIQVAFNGLGPYVARDGFFDDLRDLGRDAGPAASTSFTTDWQTAMDRLLELFSLVQSGARSANYDQGNAMMARGEGAMLVQGSWALSQIKAINPDIDLGMIPMPGDTPEETLLVSGVDVAITMARSTPREAEAMRFVEFLFSPEILELYAQDQQMFNPHVDAPPPTNPTLAELQRYFDEGRLWGFVDHQFPPAIPLGGTLQQMVFSGNVAQATTTLDTEWQRFAARTLD